MTTPLFRELTNLDVLPFYSLPSGDHVAHYVDAWRGQRQNALRGAFARTLRLAIPPRWRCLSPKLKNKELGSPLLDLPRELLVKILRSSHPLDLYELSRTCTAFDELLRRPNPEDRREMHSIWSTSFNRATDIPTRPAGFTQYQWISFLFGPAVCQKCGADGALLCFGINLKCCNACLKVLLISEDLAHRLCRKHGGVHHTRSYDHQELVDICHRAQNICLDGGSAQKWLRNVDVPSLHPDILKIEFEEKMAVICWECVDETDGDPQAKHHEARQLVAKWQVEVGLENRRALSASNWAERLYDSAWQSQCDLYTQRLFKRIWGMGYRPNGIAHGRVFLAKEIVTYLYECKRHNGIVSRRDFRHHLTAIIPHVEKARKVRLSGQAKTPGEAYYDTLSGKEALHFPYALWYREKDSPMVAASFPKALLDWRRSIQGSLIRLLEESHRGPIKSSSFKDLISTNGVQVLELAAAVFSCKKCSTRHWIGVGLVGWDAISEHICGNLGSFGPHLHTSMVFSTQGSETARLLIHSLGLDPETTTAAELDSIDARWFCGNCEITKCSARRPFTRCRRALKWRECITHMEYCPPSSHDHGGQHWLLLGEDATNFVKIRETPFPLHEKALWGCALCQEHVIFASPYRSVERHLSSIHNVRSPKKGVHIIPMMNRYAVFGIGWKKHVSRRPVLYQTYPPLNCECLRCPADVKRDHGRFWSRNEIIEHLRGQHRLPKTIEGEDWRTFEIFAT